MRGTKRAGNNWKSIWLLGAMCQGLSCCYRSSIHAQSLYIRPQCYDVETTLAYPTRDVTYRRGKSSSAIRDTDCDASRAWRVEVTNVNDPTHVLARANESNLQEHRNRGGQSRRDYVQAGLLFRPDRDRESADLLWSAFFLYIRYSKFS